LEKLLMTTASAVNARAVCAGSAKVIPGAVEESGIGKVGT